MFNQPPKTATKSPPNSPYCCFALRPSRFVTICWTNKSAETCCCYHGYTTLPVAMVFCLLVARGAHTVENVCFSGFSCWRRWCVDRTWRTSCAHATMQNTGRKLDLLKTAHHQSRKDLTAGVSERANSPIQSPPWLAFMFLVQASFARHQ